MTPVDQKRIRKLLRLRMTGYFYRLVAPLDAGFASEVFARIATRRGVSPLFNKSVFVGSAKSKERHTYEIFRIKKSPGFAPACDDLVETRYGFCYLLESGKILFVAHAGFAWSDALLPIDEPERLTADDAFAVLGSLKQPRVDRVSTRSMTVASKAIHGRTLEGDDLESALPSLGAGRHVVRNVRAVEAATGATLSLVPGSSRLSQLGPRLEVDAVHSWFKSEVIKRLASKRKFSFLLRFARAIRFDEVPSNIDPTGISFTFDIDAVSGTDWELESIAGSVRHVEPDVMRRLLGRLKQRLSKPARLVADGSRLKAVYPLPIGTVVVRQNKKSYSIENRFLKRLRFLDPETQAPVSVLSYINEQRAFLITFSSVEYAYVNAQMVKSPHVVESLRTLLKIVEKSPRLAAATTEKGNLRGQVDPASIFGIIESTCARKDALLLLDDGAREWADYIGVRYVSGEPMVTFYHAKHTGKASTSASVLQEVLGQAEKNIGWMFATSEQLSERNKDYWAKPYKWPTGGRVDRVRRLKRGTSVEQFITAAIMHPKALRRVCVVVSSLTYTALKALVDSKGRRLEPHQVQLSWLLATFASACSESGARPVIMCPP